MDAAHTYEVRIWGHLPPDWSAWFAGLEVIPQEDGSTILRGSLADQAALQGVLLKIFNLGLTLIAVARCDESAGDAQTM